MGSSIIHQRICWLRFCAATRWHLTLPCWSSLNAARAQTGIRNGSVRMVYGARACHCRPCSLRAQCQESTTTKKPASGSVPWFGPPLRTHLLRQSLHLFPLKLHLLPNPLRSQFCGVIGHAVPSGVGGSNCFVHKPFVFLLRRFNWRSNKPANRQTGTPEHNVRIGV